LSADNSASAARLEPLCGAIRGAAPTPDSASLHPGYVSRGQRNPAEALRRNPGGKAANPQHERLNYQQVNIFRSPFDKLSQETAFFWQENHELTDYQKFVKQRKAWLFLGNAMPRARDLLR